MGSEPSREMLLPSSSTLPPLLPSSSPLMLLLLSSSPLTPLLLTPPPLSSCSKGCGNMNLCPTRDLKQEQNLSQQIEHYLDPGEQGGVPFDGTAKEDDLVMSSLKVKPNPDLSLLCLIWAGEAGEVLAWL